MYQQDTSPGVSGRAQIVMIGNANGVHAVYTALTSIYQPDTEGDAMAKPPPGRWTPAQATRRINECAKNDDLELNYTLHIEDRMEERDLYTGDLLHLLSTGFVYDDAVPSTRDGYFKYTIEGLTPNSNGRTVAAVVIPSGCHKIKIVTLMWRDEK
jgi:hypothetical protein